MAKFISVGRYERSSGYNPYSSQSSYANYLTGRQSDIEDLEFKKAEYAWGNGELSDDDYLGAIQKRISSPLSASADLSLREKLRDTQERIMDNRWASAITYGGIGDIQDAIKYYQDKLGKLTPDNMKYQDTQDKIMSLQRNERSKQRQMEFTDITMRGGSDADKYNTLSNLYQDAINDGDYNNATSIYSQLVSMQSRLGSGGGGGGGYGGGSGSSATASDEIKDQIKWYKDEITKAQKNMDMPRALWLVAHAPEGEGDPGGLSGLYQSLVDQGYSEYEDDITTLEKQWDPSWDPANAVKIDQAQNPWMYSKVVNSQGIPSLKENTKPISDESGNAALTFDTQTDKATGEDKYVLGPDGAYYEVIKQKATGIKDGKEETKDFEKRNGEWVNPFTGVAIKGAPESIAVRNDKGELIRLTVNRDRNNAVVGFYGVEKNQEGKLANVRYSKQINPTTGAEDFMRMSDKYFQPNVGGKAGLTIGGEPLYTPEYQFRSPTPIDAGQFLWARSGAKDPYQFLKYAATGDKALGNIAPKGSWGETWAKQGVLGMLGRGIQEFSPIKPFMDLFSAKGLVDKRQQDLDKQLSEIAAQKRMQEQQQTQQRQQLMATQRPSLPPIAPYLPPMPSAPKLPTSPGIGLGPKPTEPSPGVGLGPKTPSLWNRLTKK